MKVSTFSFLKQVAVFIVCIESLCGWKIDNLF